MAGNTLGQLFTVTTFGESHGPMIGCIVDGCPPNLVLSEADIQPDLDKRKPGTSRYVTQRQEADLVTIASGIYEGKTTGTPIALLIANTDQRSKDYGDIAMQFRPGHADYTYHHKYGIRDPRGGGRSSARLTAPIVAAGAIAKKYLQQYFNTTICAYVEQIGTCKINFENTEYIHQNPFFAANDTQIHELEAYMNALRKSGDSCGAQLKVVAHNVPKGLGEPVFDKLDADIAYVMMGLNAVKAVAIGDGFNVVEQLGSIHGDEITPDGFLSNHAGGILGGISTGQAISVTVAIKPTSSILIEKQSVNIHNESIQLMTKGRHDPCVGLRAAPIIEALLALVLIDHLLRHRGQCGQFS
jgi:chorismate synthase